MKIVENSAPIVSRTGSVDTMSPTNSDKTSTTIVKPDNSVGEMVTGEDADTDDKREEM